LRGFRGRAKQSNKSYFFDSGKVSPELAG